MSTSAILMILSSLLFSMMGVFVRYASASVPVTEIVFFRNIIGLILVIPIMIHRKKSFIGHNIKILLIRGITGFIALSCYFVAISKIPLATAVMLNYTAPLFVALLAPVFLSERFNLKIFLLIVLGFIGIVLIVHPQPQVNIHGLFFGLTSGIFAALAYISIGALRKDNSSSLTIVFYFFIISTLLSIPLAWPTFRPPNLIESLLLCGVGLFATFAQIFMTRAYRIGKTTTTSSYSTSIIIFSLIFGMIFWKETPDLISVIGGIIVATSVVFISQMEKTDVLSTEP